MIALAVRGRRESHWGDDRSGFSLLELMIATALLATLSAMVVPALVNAREQGRIAEASTTIAAMSLDLQRYRDLNGRYPTTLAEAGLDGQRDPWGGEYRYLVIEGRNGVAGLRKDRFLVPLNSDYDLYSAGADLATAAPLNHPTSADDIVRANNGIFVGLASEF